MIWGIVILILLIGTISVFLILNRTPTDPKVVYKVPSDTSQLQREQNRVPKENAHVHEDGTFHAGEHLSDTVPASDPMSEPKLPAIKIPADIKTPEALAAWKRLEYISKNRHQWGNFSHRALELMEELTPLPELGSSEYGDCGEELIFTLAELAELRDPRSAELLVSYQIDSAIWGRPIDESLVAMGPASVPALIDGLNPERAGEVMLHVPIDLLPQIVEAHRSELGGIVQHIIIPRLEAIAAPENPEDYALSNKLSALEALNRFQKLKIFKN